MRIAKEIASMLYTDSVVNGMSLDYTEKLIAAKLEPVRDALDGLYGHTQNNHQICGLNYMAEQALAMLSEEA